MLFGFCAKDLKKKTVKNGSTKKKNILL